MSILVQWFQNWVFELTLMKCCLLSTSTFQHSVTTIFKRKQLLVSSTALAQIVECFGLIHARLCRFSQERYCCHRARKQNFRERHLWTDWSSAEECLEGWTARTICRSVRRGSVKRRPQRRRSSRKFLNNSASTCSHLVMNTPYFLDCWWLFCPFFCSHHSASITKACRLCFGHKRFHAGY